MSALITELIDKQDNFEIIRDQIAGVLKLESDNQVDLATLAGKDNPNEWKLRVFIEHSNPWEQYLENKPEEYIPIVNVWYDDSTVDLKSSNQVKRQKYNGTFNIDCYGPGLAKDDGNDGHIPGDKDAALVAQRALRLSRNIIMSAQYKQLNLKGQDIVWSRMVQSIKMFQPDMSGRQTPHVVGCRIALNVEYNEFSPQFQPEVLEQLNLDIQLNDAQEIVSVSYDYPLT